MKNNEEILKKLKEQKKVLENEITIQKSQINIDEARSKTSSKKAAERETNYHKSVIYDKQEEMKLIDEKIRKIEKETNYCKNNKDFANMVNSELKANGIQKSDNKDKIVVAILIQNEKDLVASHGPVCLPDDQDDLPQRKINIFKSIRTMIEEMKKNGKKKKENKKQYPEGPIDLSGDEPKKNKEYAEKQAEAKKKEKILKNNAFDRINEDGKFIIK